MRIVLRSERKNKYSFKVSKFISKLPLNVLIYILKFFIPKDLLFFWKFISKMKNVSGAPLLFLF
ncbi:hypothetical protein CH362_17460 [Leptospira saintgironsiae]|uniref:Uncharacterized protein n=1 Tax=Leptospira saintgironsiae TaxID=2023183 RepID=A0A2M9Y820_9LEPT|nr:hypothetical protein CH362_17460 [Leptospira saintgironsiae]